MKIIGKKILVRTIKFDLHAPTPEPTKCFLMDERVTTSLDLTTSDVAEMLIKEDNVKFSETEKMMLHPVQKIVFYGEKQLFKRVFIPEKQCAGHTLCIVE